VVLSGRRPLRLSGSEPRPRARPMRQITRRGCADLQPLERASAFEMEAGAENVNVQSPRRVVAMPRSSSSQASAMTDRTSARGNRLHTRRRCRGQFKPSSSRGTMTILAHSVRDSTSTKTVHMSIVWPLHAHTLVASNTPKSNQFVRTELNPTCTDYADHPACPCDAARPKISGPSSGAARAPDARAAPGARNSWSAAGAHRITASGHRPRPAPPRRLRPPRSPPPRA